MLNPLCSKSGRWSLDACFALQSPCPSLLPASHPPACCLPACLCLPAACLPVPAPQAAAGGAVAAGAGAASCAAAAGLQQAGAYFLPRCCASCLPTAPPNHSSLLPPAPQDLGSKAHSVDFIRKRLERELDQVCGGWGGRVCV